MAIYCMKCEAANADGSKFCGSCGNSIGGASPQNSSETIIFDGRGSQVANRPLFVVCGILAGAFLVGGNMLASEAESDAAKYLFAPMARGSFLIWALVAYALWADVRYRRYLITTDRIEVEKGSASLRVDNLDLARVKDIRLEMSAGERRANIGTLIVVSSDKSSPGLRMRGLPDARRIYDRLKLEIGASTRRIGVVRVEA